MKKGIIIGVLAVISSIFILSILHSLSNSNDVIESTSLQVGAGPSESLKFGDTVCTSTTGAFEGRKTPAHKGIDEFVGCTHNVVYAIGLNLTRDMFISGNGINATTISLCNASAGCAPPASAGTETYTALTVCGLAKQNCTTSDYGIQGNWTCTSTFTSTNACTQSITINVTRLELTNGTKFAGATITSITLDPTSGDQTTQNWTGGLS